MIWTCQSSMGEKNEEVKLAIVRSKQIKICNRQISKEPSMASKRSRGYYKMRRSQGRYNFSVAYVQPCVE